MKDEPNYVYVCNKCEGTRIRCVVEEGVYYCHDCGMIYPDLDEINKELV